MKKLILLAILLLTANVLYAVDPMFYIDFDNRTPTTLASGQTYTLDSSERGTSVTAIYAEVMGAADGVDIKIPNGDGTLAPASSGPQGDGAMVIDSSGKEEGLNVELSQAYPIGDYTVEATFWLQTNNISGNTVGLQNIWTADWPSGSYAMSNLRVIGDANAVGRPADNQHLELVIGTSGGEVRIESTSVISAATWHTAQCVFDYNEATPASSTAKFYLDGALQGTTTYDAATSYDHGFAIYGTPVTGARAGIGSWRFSIGCSTNRMINGADNRGVQGAIDAFSITPAALTSGQFVLPGGFSAVDNWSIY